MQTALSQLKSPSPIFLAALLSLAGCVGGGGTPNTGGLGGGGTGGGAGGAAGGSAGGAAGGSGGGTAADGGTSTDGGTAPMMTIAAARAANLTTPFTANAVVTGLHGSPGDYSEWYVEDPAGGANSGVAVYCDPDKTACPTIRAPPLYTLVQITGTLSTYKNAVELIPTAQVIVQSSATPPPAVDIANTEAEETGTSNHRGVYVRLTGNLTVDALTPAALLDTSCTTVVATDGGTYGEPLDGGLYSCATACSPPAYSGFQVNDGAGHELYIENFFYYTEHLQNSPECFTQSGARPVSIGETFTAMAGIFDYDGYASAQALYPVQDSDYTILGAGGGTAGGSGGGSAGGSGGGSAGGSGGGTAGGSGGGTAGGSGGGSAGGSGGGSAGGSGGGTAGGSGGGSAGGSGGGSGGGAAGGSGGGTGTAGIVNGDFESGLTGWTTTGTVAASTTAESGAASAEVGSNTASGVSTLAQTFTVPATGGTLSFWYQTFCFDSGVSYAYASATLADVTAGTSTTPLAQVCSKSAAWVQVTSAALTAGHTMTLTLSNYEKSAGASYYNYTLFDNVQITAPATRR